MMFPLNRLMIAVIVSVSLALSIVTVSGMYVAFIHYGLIEPVKQKLPM